MKKLIYRIFTTLITLVFLLVAYLSTIGFETDKFNDQIKNRIKKIDQNLEIDLKKIKIILDPFNFEINVKTLGPRLSLQNSIIDLESIESLISLKSMINKEFSISNLDISSKSVEIKKVISFARGITKNTKLLILENFITEGILIADIKLEFDKDGNIKNNFNIKGFVKDSEINFFKKHDLSKINFIFNLNEKVINLDQLQLTYNRLGLFFEKISIENNKENFLINGELNNKNLTLNNDIIQQFLNLDYYKIKKVNLDSETKFSFKLDKKFKFKDLNFKSKVKINDLIISNNFELKEIFPNAKSEINFNDHNIDINYDKKIFDITGSGNVLLQDSNDKLDYEIKKDKESLKFNTLIEIQNNPLFINFLNFKKDIKNLTKITFKGEINSNDIKFNKILLQDENNKIEVDKIVLNKDLKVLYLTTAQFNYLDKEDVNNNFKIVNKDKNYLFKGSLFNANNLVDNLLDSNDDSSLPFKNDFKLYVKLDQIRLDEEFVIKKFEGSLNYDKNTFNEANLNGFYENEKKIKITINSSNNEKITTLYSDYAKPFIKRYKFIKGFDGGSLDFYSNKVNNKTTSFIKVYDFKLNELPALTKLLTLASLQGIADLLTGEGIRFNEFEMNFNSEGSLMTIEEIYAIGPAISILMDGYIEKKKLISLRGTLVPATTLNKVIGSIPFLGDILVGSKTGEGVFGVSFKIKGPPKKLETSVNPIKTLTPRFITRTLEKIKRD